MQNHDLPPQEKIDHLEPYRDFTSTLILVLGILGGWAGNAWPWVLAIYLARSGFVTGCIYTSLSFLVGIITYRGLTLLYKEHENRERIEDEMLRATIYDALSKYNLVKQLRDSEAQYRELFETSLDAIVTTDPEGILLQANLAFAELLGLDPASIPGKNITSFSAPEFLLEDCCRVYSRPV